MQLYELLSYLLRLFENDFNRESNGDEGFRSFLQRKDSSFGRLVIE